MISFFRYELKSSIKGLLIWSLSVGCLGLFCILLYKSMEESIGDIAGSMASMGAFSDAFGMSTLSIATLKGYFATEIGTIHSLGIGLFAASVATVVFSKEEDAHTAEYTFTLPLTRGKIIASKVVSVLINLVLFTLIAACLYVIGFFALGEKEIGAEFIKFMALQLVMGVEISSFCLAISAINKKSKPGIGICTAMLFYIYDLMARVVPKLKDVIFLSPYSYSNATTIFSNESPDAKALIFGLTLTLLLGTFSSIYYAKKDLAS